jgi:hypothetical protein
MMATRPPRCPVGNPRWHEPSGIRVLSAPALLILPALTGGCLCRNAPARFYMLTAVPYSPVATPSTESGRAPELGVGSVTLPRYLERTNIVTRRGMEMEVAEFDRWAEPLSESVPPGDCRKPGDAAPDRTHRCLPVVQHGEHRTLDRGRCDPLRTTYSASSTSTCDRGTELSRPARA